MELFDGRDFELFHGDCLEVMKSVPSGSVHMVATDPPYFIDGLDDEWKKGKLDKQQAKQRVVGGMPVGMKFDRQQGPRLQSFMKQVSLEMFRLLKPGGFCVSFAFPRLSHHLAMALELTGFEIRDNLAWRFHSHAQAKAFTVKHFVDRMDKPQAWKDKAKRLIGERRTPQLRPQYESILLAQKPKDGTMVENFLEHGTGLINWSATMGEKTPSTVIEVEKQPVKGHLTAKPVSLMQHLIELFSSPGHIVLDPFLGSGTTAIAAQRCGRRCLGIEIDQDYLEMAGERLRNGGELPESESTD